MEIIPSRRRRPAEPDLPPGDPILIERLRAEIDARGPITFARFMEVALGDPERGYYVTSGDRPTRSGDFLTSPELHPIFGATIARAIDEQWQALDRPGEYVLREYGAGTGTLALDLLRGLRASGSDLLDAVIYEPVELGGRAAQIAERLADAGFRHAMRAAEIGTSRVGMALANEYIDALPVHRLVAREDGLREVFVDWSSQAGAFVDLEATPSTPALEARLADERVGLEPGQVAEVCLAIDAWLDDVDASLARGFATVIDYGHPGLELYRPTRRAGTASAYVGHRVHPDLYAAVGRQDLTAHVDFTAVANAGVSRGWVVLGLTSQAEFLVGTGLQELLAGAQGDPSLEPAAYVELRASVMRLLDPRALGGFRVLVLAKGVPAGIELQGLRYRARR